jgi:DNA-binding transcriptional LysR family regulator
LQQTVLNMVDEGVGVALVPASMRKSRLPGVAFRPLAAAPQSELVLLWSARNRNPCLSNFLALAAPA